MRPTFGAILSQSLPPATVAFDGARPAPPARPAGDEGERRGKGRGTRALEPLRRVGMARPRCVAAGVEAWGVTQAGRVAAGRAGWDTPLSTNVRLEGMRLWLGATAANLQSGLLGAARDMDLSLPGQGVEDGRRAGGPSVSPPALKRAPGSQESSCKAPLRAGG